MLKSTGVVRQVDELGRITLPIELRRNLNIDEKDALEIFVNGGQIVLQKYQRGCSVCGNAEDELKAYGSVQICPGCREAIAREHGKQVVRR